jgi:hypothetical protein
LKAKAAKVPHTDNVELPTPDDHLDFIFKHPPPRQAPTLAVASFYGLDDDSMHNMNFNSGPRAYCFILIFIIMHYQFKQDLAMAYFDGCSKKTRPGGCSCRAAGLDLQSRPIEYKDFQSARQQCTEPK